MKPSRLATQITLLAAACSSTAAPLPAGVKSALDNEHIGLLDTGAFRLNTGPCTDCRSIKQAVWYFEHEVTALPGPGATVSGFSRDADRVIDIKQWSVSPESRKLAQPQVVWLGSPFVLDNGRVSGDGKSVTTPDGSTIPLKLAPKLATNLSYANADTMDFFGQRELRMRGSIDKTSGEFIARTVWPRDFNLDSSKIAQADAKNPIDLTSLVRSPLKPGSAIDARVLWERQKGQQRKWAGKPVIGIVLSGAQGDDDESLGGHFAVATGRYGENGEWADWAVNNFYNLDSVSEKGILAGTVPMDNYLMDLNSGQQYYRPSYMLVAILHDPRTAVAYQGAVQRTFNHFYRHDFTYKHADANCAGINVDVFKALGWNIPERGEGAPIKAIGAYFYLAAKDRSLDSGRKIYDYLTEEQTRLYPAVAFDAIGQDLLRIVGALPAERRALSGFEQELRSDIDALVLVRIPQIPSSRAAGSSPVFSFDEYMSRVPADHAKWKIVPAAPRPFPSTLRDGDALHEQGSPAVPRPVIGLVAVVVAGLLALARYVLRKRNRRA
jgi:hypothetical protein